MTTTIQHFSHPEHTLELKDEVVSKQKVSPMCYACNKPIITASGSSNAAYTCTSCDNFFLHKRCAELPIQIKHPMHNKHSLTLLPRLSKRSFCDVCKRKLEHFGYRCDVCDYDICATCTFEKDRVFHHISHNDHSLNLIRREALFDCDACGQKAQDSSYICNHCDFWIHRSCASSTTTISVPNFHHHPMQLVFAIPDMHRSSDQFCGKCKKSVGKNYWSYYCEECTYFVHIRCDASSDTTVRTESSAQENPGQVSASVWDHFSHPEHSLIFNDEDLCEYKPTCYACNKPIINVQGSAYTCTSCEGFFLHKRCAELATQINHPLHNKHSLTLVPRLLPRSFCDICKHKWEHFAYRCEDCDFDICILCTFEEDHVFRHISHDDHSFRLIRREALFDCDACGQEAKDLSYSCNNCDFWIHKSCASSTTTVSVPSFHHHTMQLIFAIPDMHRSSDCFCGKCKKLVRKNYWSYYCQECTYFVHLRCATSRDTMTRAEIDHNAQSLHATLSLLDFISNMISCLASC